MHILKVVLTLVTAAAALAATPAPTLPVSVSAANYKNTPWDQLRQKVSGPHQVNPLDRETAPLAQPELYVFTQGEIYESDLTYEQVCQHLEAALAKKGYVNAADAQGRVAHMDKITLILRVSSGGRRWRNPSVRTEHLTWKQGLADTVKTTSSLLGGVVAFDNRAGGNDDALGMAIAEQGKIGSTTGGITESSQSGTDSSGYESTRDFFLLVVDAFDYKELVEKQPRTPRKWTTFIALPREAHNSFAAVLPTMLKVATPYFGETTSGLQVFNDARATVKLGELEVVESDVKPLSRGKK